MLLLRLNKYLYFLFIFIIFSHNVYAEPKDIWDKSKKIKKIEKNNNKLNKGNKNSPNLPETVFSKDKKINLKASSINQAEISVEDEIIFGLYEPDQSGIDLNFWSNLKQKDLSKSLNKILLEDKQLINLKKQIFFSKINLNSFEDEGKVYLSFISKWLIKNTQMQLIDNVIYQNSIIKKDKELLEFLFNYYLSNYQVEKACSYTKLMTSDLDSKELDKYKIFCHLHNKEFQIALSKLELGIENKRFDNFFIKKVNEITGIENTNQKNYNNILNAHMTVISNKQQNIDYINFSKKSELRNYYFKSKLYKNFLNNDFLENIEDNKLNDIIIFLERSANDELIDIENLITLYKKMTFTIDDLINPKTASKKYQRPVSHALLFQALIISQDDFIKYEILKVLKEKLYLNGLNMIADKIYLDQISKLKPDIISKEDKLLIKNANKTQNNIHDYLYKSNIINLINNKKDKNAYKSLKQFSKKTKQKKYKLNKKDLALINLLHKNKIKLPDNFKKNIYKEELYIPNNIFNLIDNKKKNLALLKTIEFTNKLQNEQDYLKNFLIIIKIFDELKMPALKKIFTENELSIT